MGGAIGSLVADWLPLTISLRRVVKIPRSPILTTRRKEIARARLSLRRPLYTERFGYDLVTMYRNLRRIGRKS